MENKGICLIINNIEYRKGDNRGGSEHDAKRLAEIFKSRGFIVDPRTNCTANKMEQLLQQYSSYDDTLSSCFVCCILAHGDSGVVTFTDGQALPIATITGYFTNDACSSFGGKPKIFFIQACRGTRDMPKRWVRDSPEFTAPKKISLPLVSDIVIGHSTVDGYTSARASDHGALFIQTLCDVIEQYGERYHLMELFAVVSERVAHEEIDYQTDAKSRDEEVKQPAQLVNKITKKTTKQSVWYEGNLRKKVYLRIKKTIRQEDEPLPFRTDEHGHGL